MRRISALLRGEEPADLLARAPRVLGLRAGKPSVELFREILFDTVRGTLREASLELRLRQTASGDRRVRLHRVQGTSLAGIVEEEVLVEPAVGGGLYATLAGGSGLADRVRELVEPQALRPEAALDVDRSVRVLGTGMLRNPAHRLLLDRMVVHAGGETRPLVRLTLQELDGGGVSLEEIADRLKVLEGLLRVLDGIPRWGRPRERRPAEKRGRAGTDLVVVPIRDGDAWVSPHDPRPFPTAHGSGERAARHLAAPWIGDGPGGLEFLGFTSDATGADLEVWTCRVAADATPPGGSVRMPLLELLERCGAPYLDGPRLAAALELLSRTPEVGAAAEAAGGARPRPVPLGHALEPGGPGPAPEGPAAPGGGPPADGDDTVRYLDPELGILDFNARVLELAADPGVPLLERVRFLSIFESNLDEFFAVRYPRLHGADGADGDTGGLLRQYVVVRTRALGARRHAVWKELRVAMARAGLRIARWSDLGADERASLEARYEDEIAPLLTPRQLAGSWGRSASRVPHLRPCLLLVPGDPRSGPPSWLALPAGHPRFLEVHETGTLVPLDDVVAARARALVPAADVGGVHPFRATRLSDVSVDDDPSASLLEAVADEVLDRPWKPVVRLEVAADTPAAVRALLLREIRGESGGEGALLTERDVFGVDGLVDLTDVAELCDRDLADAHYPPLRPRRPFEGAPSVFAAVDEADRLVHHPFDEFESTVVRFLDEAAADPAVASIKITLYRTGRDAPVVDALLAALRAGKDVSVFVELQARFDEERNVEWTRRIRDAGGHVGFGVAGYKTHAKVALVVRREGDGRIRRYVHVGTGNYNSATSRAYTDLGLFTAADDIGAEVQEFFNELLAGTGPPNPAHEHLWIAPASLASGLAERIEREREHARAGRPARIRAKMNGLSDRRIVDALYDASADGVEVELSVRGLCTLRPGVAGLSANVRVRSTLGRFLEHARIFHFHDAGDDAWFIGSADWRHRNLRRRIEVVAPVRDEAARETLDALLGLELSAGRAWVLRADGVYERILPDEADLHTRLTDPGTSGLPERPGTRPEPAAR